MCNKCTWHRSRLLQISIPNTSDITKIVTSLALSAVVKPENDTNARSELYYDPLKSTVKKFI